MDEKRNEKGVSSRAEGPLTGVRVLDFTMVLAGPFCTRLLADMGAEVIKVEPPQGDSIRSRRPIRNGYSRIFGHLNAGKQSIVLDLKGPGGRGAAIELARLSDVVVENWRPGVAERLGIGYPTLSTENSRLIYCSLSGFGQAGPSAAHPAYAPIVQAASGYDLAQAEYQGGGRPLKTGTFIGDVMGGLAAFAAIQSALYRRSQIGKGQFIDVSLLECMYNLLIHECQEAQNPLDGPSRLYRPLKTIDGFVVVAPTSQNNLKQIALTLEHPEWFDDPRFATPHARESNWSTLMDLIEVWTSVRSSEACESTLLSAGVPCSRYKTIGDAFADPHSTYRQSFAEMYDGAGSYLIPNAPFRMPGLNTAVRTSFPDLGSSTARVLKELLQYSDNQISSLMKPR